MTPHPQGLRQSPDENPRDRRGGFTMIEMLVVIGIIALLLSILLPTITRMQIIGQMSQTNGEISSIAAACHQYYNTYRAFPGPFSNDQIENQTAAGGVTNSTTGATLTGNVTGTENLVLGLLGGLNVTTNTTTGAVTVVYNSGEVGIGSIVLNSNNPQRMNFFSTGSGTTYLLSSGSFVDGAGHAANDSPIPEFIDYFKTGLPLLYMRARVGAPGIVGYKQTYQYDMAEVTGYTATTIGGHTHGLLGTNLGSFAAGSTIKNQFPNDAGVYLMNPNVAAASASNIQGTGRPRVTDGFIILSAGPDGIYGNYDDLTSFGALAD